MNKKLFRYKLKTKSTPRWDLWDTASDQRREYSGERATAASRHKQTH